MQDAFFADERGAQVLLHGSAPDGSQSRRHGLITPASFSRELRRDVLHAHGMDDERFGVALDGAVGSAWLLGSDENAQPQIASFTDEPLEGSLGDGGSPLGDVVVDLVDDEPRSGCSGCDAARPVCRLRCGVSALGSEKPLVVLRLRPGVDDATHENGDGRSNCTGGVTAGMHQSASGVAVSCPGSAGRSMVRKTFMVSKTSTAC